MGSRCSTFSNFALGAPETRWVGESGVRTSGCAASIAWSSRMSRSYSASERRGRSRA
jgi:hypothetical protein